MENLDIGFTVWLFILTAANIWLAVSFYKLSKFSERSNIQRLIDKIKNRQKDHDKNLKTLEKRIEEIVNAAKLHIQKVGLVRFNPFQELGGDHSFSLALLDKNETGFVITALHARDRTRVYVKKVNKGKSKLSLSKEEEKALNAALKGEGGT